MLGTINSLKSVVVDGNPMKSIRRDIIMVGTGSSHFDGYKWYQKVPEC